MKKVISVVGNVASGKTTLAHGLAKELPGHLIDGDPYKTNPFLEEYAQDRVRWALATELHFTLSRYKQLTEEFAKDKHKPLVIDSGLAMGIGVYVKQHLFSKTMTQAEYDLFREITSTLVPREFFYPNVAIVTKCSIDTSLKRIRGRGREFEQSYDPKYLSSLAESLDLLIANFTKRRVKVITLDSERYDLREKNGMKSAIQFINTQLNL